MASTTYRWKHCNIYNFTDQVTSAHRNLETNFWLTITRVSQYPNQSIPQYLQVPAHVSAQPPLPRQVRPGTRFPIFTIFITNSYQYGNQHDHYPPVYQHLCKLFCKFLDVPDVKFDKKNILYIIYWYFCPPSSNIFWKKCSKPSWRAFSSPLPPLSGNVHMETTHFKKGLPYDDDIYDGWLFFP